MPRTFQLGQVVVTIYDGWTVTRFPGGYEAHARHDDCRHVGQAATAQDLGYPDVVTMNQDHDLCHSLLACWCGLGQSPVLYDVARDLPLSPQAWIEETAVLALQRFLRQQGLRVDALAQKG